MFLSHFYPRTLLIPAPPSHAHSYGAAVIPGNLGRRVKRTVVSAATYTAVAQDEYVVPTENCTVTLPAASSVPDGYMLMVANPVPGLITVLVSPAGTDTISGIAGSVTLASTIGMTTLVSDGVDNWETATPLSNPQ